MPASKGASGTAQEGARERKKADAKRGARYRTDEIAAIRALGAPPLNSPDRAFPWLARIALLAVEGAATDPGLRPEQAREQLVRLIPQAVKALDPARMAQRIDTLEKALEDLTDGREVETRTAGGTGSEAAQ